MVNDRKRVLLIRDGDFFLGNKRQRVLIGQWLLRVIIGQQEMKKDNSYWSIRDGWALICQLLIKRYIEIKLSN